MREYKVQQSIEPAEMTTCYKPRKEEVDPCKSESLEIREGLEHFYIGLTDAQWFN